MLQAPQKATERDAALRPTGRDFEPVSSPISAARAYRDDRHGENLDLGDVCEGGILFQVGDGTRSGERPAPVARTR